jgi:hypothetical protein
MGFEYIFCFFLAKDENPPKTGQKKVFKNVINFMPMPREI